MADIKSSSITFSLAQMGTILTVVCSGVVGAAAWATKVDSQLTEIQKSVATIESSLKEINAVNTSQNLAIQRIQDRCCTSSEAREHWMPVMPAVLPDNRRRHFLSGAHAVATGGRI